jgi:rhamnogalacturonan endolyase
LCWVNRSLKTQIAITGIAAVFLAVATARGADGAAVKLVEGARDYTLDNGVVAARIEKGSGNLESLKYKGRELLGSARPGGYWSHTPARGGGITNSVTIDPATNGGERAEVSVKGFYRGTPLGSGPGGSTACDIEIRYALGRGDSGLYTYSIFTHQPEYPATSIGEARFCVKLDDAVFDHLTVDANRNLQVASAADWDNGTQLNLKEARRLNTGIHEGQVEHKYDYSAVQFDVPAYGWSSMKQRIGCWMVNPSMEYLSGGATKVELTGHLVATLLNYWRGSHYGSSSCDIAQGEAWTKVVGPFQLYCNSNGSPDELWHDALAHAAKEAEAWPYDWVNGVDYPHKDGRGTVRGRIVLNDALAPDAKMTHLLVGLAHPDYETSDGRGGKSTVDWQLDAKDYEFWVRGDADGKFTIPNVRPGIYTLHAIADGVLGEYELTNVTVAAGHTTWLVEGTNADAAMTGGNFIDRAPLKWQPLRYGPQLWEIGVPDRSAAEFLHGDHYWQWGLYNDYPKDSPDDVNFVIGKSDYHRDWNFAQCPRADRPNGTTWSVTFNLPEAPRGRGVLRLALAGVSARRIEVTMNDQPAGMVGSLKDNATIRRDGIRGYWTERDVKFDASLMKAGENVLKLTIPPGNAMNGVEYDYLRLELEPEGGT